MRTLMQATLLNSDPNTLLSACSITIKVCPNTGTIAFRIHLSLRTILFPLTFASGSSANRRRQSAQYNDRRCIIALQFNYRLLCTGNESFRSSCQHDAVSHPIDVFFLCFWMMLVFTLTRFLTTNNPESSSLFIPSVKMLMVLLSKVSHANADISSNQATVVQLCCALLHENIRTEDDTDDMQV